MERGVAARGKVRDLDSASRLVTSQLARLECRAKPMRDGNMRADLSARPCPARRRMIGQRIDQPGPNTKSRLVVRRARRRRPAMAQDAARRSSCRGARPSG